MNAMASPDTHEAVDKLLEEMRPVVEPLQASFNVTNGFSRGAHNWILHSNRNIDPSDTLAPVVDAIRRIRDVQNGMTDTLDDQGKELVEIKEKQAEITSELKALRDGTAAFEAQMQLDGEEAISKHPDATVRVLSAAVRHLQNNQAQMREIITTLRDQLANKDDEKRKEQKRRELEPVRAKPVEQAGRSYATELPIRKKIREIGKGGLGLAPEISHRPPIGPRFEVDRSIADLNMRLQSLESGFAKGKQEFTFNFEKKLKDLEENLFVESSNQTLTTTLNRVYLATQVETLKHQMAVIWHILALAQSMPDSPIRGVEAGKATSGEYASSITYWRDKLVNASKNEGREQSSINSIMGTIKSSLPRQKGGWSNPNVEKPPDGNGASFLTKIGKWFQACFDDIHETRLRVCPATRLKDLSTTRKRSAEDVLTELRAKRRLAEAVPRGLITGDLYPPGRDVDSYRPKGQAPSNHGGKT
ncbi:hypothetical protein AOQ84DRAFT_225281 [Glonium stellatum]|uniref:Uncharacterized protein n=1 Tax=Glonium stellatum TaxID=574774 RepID=A0A8E2FAQ4_9PEZI|nr:hypothetical protein AOQ84DRAFT_225281 [Glonium stellatum]